MIYLKEGQTPLNFAYNDEVVQEGNSKYQLSFKFPTNNPLWEELVEETLLLADDLHGEQEFIIFEVEKHHAYITVYANQVATLLNNYSITELSVNNASGDRVMRSLVSSIIREHKFTFSSDITNTHTLNLKNVTVANALFKDKHSILGQWGGDLIRDKYDIRLLSNGGTNKEVLFMYKKNLKSYQHKKSIKDLRTRIHFTKTINSQKEGEKDKVIAVTVDSPLIGKYKNIYEGNLDVSDQDVTDEVTLRKYGENYFKTTLCDVIEESIEIDVVGTPDELVGIFDTVTIFHEKFNLDVKKKITKYTYSPMGRKLKTIGFGKIQSNLGTTLATMVDNAIEEKAETMLDAFKIQKNLAQLLKLDRKGIEDKLVELEEKSKGALEVKRALFEADGNIPDVVKAKILDAVEGDIGRLKTIITEAELIKAIQAKLNYAEIKNALIDKAFINQIISDEKFTQQFEDGQVTTQNIFTKLKDSIKSNISKEFITKEGVKKIVNDLTIDADGIRQITQQESVKVFENKKQELKGINSYLHKKYSDYADGRSMDNNSNRKYIGIYTGEKQQAPTSASEYSWSKIRGEDGADGKSINRNYITDSDKLNSKGFYGWNKWDKSVEGDTLVLTKVGGSDTYGFWFNLTDLVKTQFQNEKLTWSIDIKASRNMTLRNVGFETNGKKQVNITTTWNRISHTFINKFTNVFAFVFYNPTTDFNNGDKIYIRLPKLEKGDVATEWSPAYEDLRGRDGTDGHSLTASLWFTGGYVNNVTNNVKLNLKVFYDGREIRDFRSNITYTGGNFSSWQTKENPTITSYNAIDYTFWTNGEKDGSTLFALATVTYNGLQAVADARLDNVPDVRLVNETIEKYKTFESTLDGFTSVVGEIDTKVFSKAYFKNNLNNEDVEKTKNDVYFNTKENLKANEYYTILADLENVPANRKARIYDASDGGDEKIIQNGLNYWVVKYPSDQTRINLYPLGDNTTVKNVKIYKGDFRVKKDVERENLYSDFGHDDKGFLHLFLNKNKINGNVYLLKFDASNFSNGARWDVYNRVGYNQENLTQVFKTKDNEFTFTINDNTAPNRMYLRIAAGTSPDISNVEIYDVSTEYVKNSQVSKLESSIKQTKDEIDLKVSKDNVIASINASVETTENGNQGVVKIKGEVLADNIHGKTFTGSKFEVGKSGILDSQGNNLRISSPHDWNGSSGVGMQLRGRGEGEFNQGLNIYRVNNVRNPNTPLYTPDEVALSVFGEIRGAFKINSMPKSGSLTSRMGVAVMSNVSSNTPIRAFGYPGATLYSIRSIFLRSGGGPTQIWVNDGTGGNATFGVNVANMESDIKLKENISISNHSGLDVINKFTFHSFDWKKDKFGYRKPHTKIGLIAQEVQEIQDDLVYKNPNALALDEFRLLNIALKAIQELSQENTNLKSQLKEMNERLSKLETLQQ